MNTSNKLNIIANIVAKKYEISRTEIEKPYESGAVSNARAVLVKVAFSFGLPVSAIAKVLNRSQQLTEYYLAHTAPEDVVYEVKSEAEFYFNLLEKQKAPGEEPKEEKNDDNLTK